MITTYGATEGVDEATPPVTEKQGGLNEAQMAALTRLAQNREQLDPERRALIESLAQQYKIDLPPQKGFTQLPNPAKENLNELGQSAKVSALPMGGQALGGFAGALLTGGNPAGIMAGQSIGGVAGLMGNKALGISNPDALDVALTGSVPLGARALAATGRKMIPGHAAAEQQIGAELIRETPKLLPGDAASTKAAYDKVAAMGSPTLEVPSFTKTITELATVESVAKKYGGANPTIRKGVMDASKTLQAQGGTMPFDEAAIMLKRYREKVTGLEDKGGEAYGAYKVMRKSLFDDMDAAVKKAGASGQNVTALREAMQAAKQSIAKEEYSELLQKYGTKLKTVGGATFEVIEPTNILNKLNAIDFKASVGATEFAKIEKTLKELARIPKPDLETGAGIGTPKRALAMTGVGIAGSALGGPVGGFGSAAASAGIIYAHDAVASLMMNDKGRNFLVKFFKANKGRIRESTAQILQFAATQLEDTGE